ncbi:MAG: hypothetical protein IPM82_21675 [Saprospiraceae bacterium]|nr:hypothetical protein [Saprospiraceae bacterium]
MLNDPNQFIENVTWASVGYRLIGGGNPIYFCTQPITGGTVTLTATVLAFSQNGNTFTYDVSYTFTVTNGLNPTIVPTIAACLGQRQPMRLRRFVPSARRCTR